MKIVQTETTFDGMITRVSIDISIDNKTYNLYFRQGEPEDMTFDRDLCDVLDITDMLERAYEAGKEGQDLTVEYIEKIDR